MSWKILKRAANRKRQVFTRRGNLAEPHCGAEWRWHICLVVVLLPAMKCLLSMCCIITYMAFSFQLFLMILVLSTGLRSPFLFLLDLKYVTISVILNIGLSKEEPACTGRGRQSGVCSQGPPSRTVLGVLLGLVLRLKAAWMCSYSVSSDTGRSNLWWSVLWQMCPELEPVTWFLQEKDKLEIPNLELERFRQQGWPLHRAYMIVMEELWYNK